jgi:hypothetical protein
VGQVVLLLALSTNLGATSVVVFRSDARIIIAADSTEITPGRASQRGCKVQQAGRWGFVTGSVRRVGALDVAQLVSTAIMAMTTITKALAAIEDVYTHRLKPVLTAPVLKPLFKVDMPIVTVLVAGLDAGVLTVGYFGADLTSFDPLTLVHASATCPGATLPRNVCGSDGRFFYAAAGADPSTVNLVLTVPRPAWLEKQDAAAALRLLDMAATADPHEVGRPFDVLQLDAGGMRWIGRDPHSSCAELAP